MRLKTVSLRYAGLLFYSEQKTKQRGRIKYIVGKKNKRDVTLQLSTICYVTLIIGIIGDFDLHPPFKLCRPSLLNYVTMSDSLPFPLPREG